MYMVNESEYKRLKGKKIYKAKHKDPHLDRRMLLDSMKIRNYKQTRIPRNVFRRYK